MCFLTYALGQDFKGNIGPILQMWSKWKKALVLISRRVGLLTLSDAPESQAQSEQKWALMLCLGMVALHRPMGRAGVVA